LRVFVDPDQEGASDGEGLEAINISLSGVYFRSRRYMAPMTKLAMALELAVDNPEACEGEHALVQCHGLVVRVQPEQELPQGGEYEIAVFFTWIEPEGQVILQDHISHLISQKPGT
jgi:hypothetical protein